MYRRSVLAALPATLGLAGCVGRGSLSADSPKKTLSRGSVRFSSALRYGVADDHVGVDAPANDQFVFIRPPEETQGAPPDEFALEIDDQRFHPLRDIPGFTLVTPVVSDAYTAKRPEGSLVFDVPAVEASSATLVHEETQYAIPDHNQSQFETASAMELKAVEAPDAATSGHASVSVTVRNTGDRRGLFLGGFNHGGVNKRIQPLVEPDATTTEDVLLRIWGDSGDTNRFAFVYPGGSKTFTVTGQGDE
jgi:hypothetical protein